MKIPLNVKQNVAKIKQKLRYIWDHKYWKRRRPKRGKTIRCVWQGKLDLNDVNDFPMQYAHIPDNEIGFFLCGIFAKKI